VPTFLPEDPFPPNLHFFIMDDAPQVAAIGYFPRVYHEYVSIRPLTHTMPTLAHTLGLS